MPILSIVFCVGAYLSIGHLLLGWFSPDNRGIANSFLAGSGVVSLSTLFLAMLFKENLRLISLLLLAAGNLYLCYLLFCNVQKLKRVGSLLIKFLPVILLLLLSLPIMAGSYNVKAWGDELTLGVTPVKMIFYNDLILGLEKHASYGGYPPLWPIINVNALSLLGVMHEGVGRIMSVLFILCGSLFFLDDFHKKWNISIAKSTIWAAVMLALISGSQFAWTASWYANPSFSVFLTVAMYYIILGLSTKGVIDFAKVGIGSFFLTVCVGLRPDGIHYLPFFLIITLYLLTVFRSEMWNRQVLALLLIVLPSIALFSGWQVYAVLQGFHAHDRVEIIGKLIGSGELPRIVLLTLKDIIAKVNVTTLHHFLPQYISLLICGIILMISSCNFNRRELRIVLLLLFFPIYNTLLVFGTSMAVFVQRGTPLIATTRHFLNSAPVVYLVLGILLARLYQSKNVPVIVGRVAAVITLSLALLSNLTIGGVYSHLSNDTNNYIEYLSETIKLNFPDCSNVMFIAQQSPLGIYQRWRYYRIQEAPNWRYPYSIGKGKGIDLSIVYRDTSIQTDKQFINFLCDNGVQLVVVYESDNEFNRLSGLDLHSDKAYLLGLNHDRKGLSVLWTEKRPPFNHHGTHWRTNAAKALWKDIKVWKKEKQSLPDAI